MFNKKGVTLIELIIFMGVLLILASIVTPSLASVEKRSLISAAQQLKSDLRYAQKLTIKDMSLYQVVFFVKENKYYIYSADATASPIKKVNLPRGVVTKFINAKNNAISFKAPIGTVSSACTITLETNKYSVDLTVAVGSGRVKIYDVKEK